MRGVIDHRAKADGVNETREAKLHQVPKNLGEVRPLLLYLELTPLGSRASTSSRRAEAQTPNPSGRKGIQHGFSEISASAGR